MTSETCTPVQTPENEYRGRLRRNLFTGELEEVPYEGSGIIYREPLKPGQVPVTHKRRANPWYKENRCRPLSIKPEEATPERIAAENESAKRHGTGAMFDTKGECYLPTRGSRAKEMRRKSIENQSKGGNANIVDLDAGFSDFAG